MTPTKQVDDDETPVREFKTIAAAGSNTHDDMPIGGGGGNNNKKFDFDALDENSTPDGKRLNIAATTPAKGPRKNGLKKRLPMVIQPTKKAGGGGSAASASTGKKSRVLAGDEGRLELEEQ